MKKFLTAFIIATTVIVPVQAGIISHGVAYGAGHAGKGALKKRVTELEQENQKLRAQIKKIKQQCDL